MDAETQEPRFVERGCWPRSSLAGAAPFGSRALNEGTMNRIHTRWEPADTRASARASGAGQTWRAGVLIAVLFAGSTLLTPLYPAYQRAFGFGPLVLTLVYGAYV